MALEFFKWVWGLLLFPLAFLFRKTNDNERLLTEHKLYVANHLVKHTALLETELRILTAINELKTDLKTKADK